MKQTGIFGGSAPSMDKRWGAACRKSAPNLDRMIFSGVENCCRNPPTDSLEVDLVYYGI